MLIWSIRAFCSALVIDSWWTITQVSERMEKRSKKIAFVDSSDRDVQ